MNKYFGLSDREINEFTLESCKEIVDYCDDNRVSICTGDIDVVVGGYQKWLLDNGFKIIDTKAVDIS